MKLLPTKPAFLLALLALLISSLAMAQGESALQGDIRFAAERTDAVWLGQELELYLDLWSSGYSFGDQSFVLPEVKGAYLMQADSSTIKLNERRDGVQWQGLRYTFFLYPQRAGRLEVPSFKVAFSARAGFGTEPAGFSFDTPAIPVESQLPPGADASGLLVSTTSFAMESSWNPAQAGEGPTSLKVGDAVTLQVTRRAQDVPGMVFAPLPDFSIDGLRSYPDPARVNDRINRGSLTGVRADSVTFVCEREGSFEIPEMRFQWWDPVQEVLSEKVIPSREFSVVANPAYASGASGPSTNTTGPLQWKTMLAIVVIALLLMVPGRGLLKFAGEWLRQRRVDREAGEPWAFRQVQKACAAGSPAGAYRAMTVWLGRMETGRPGLTLMQMAAASGDAGLLRELTLLQVAISAGSTDEWSGGKLAQLLVKFRNHSDQPAQSAHVLHPLNPRAIKSR